MLYAQLTKFIKIQLFYLSPKEPSLVFRTFFLDMVIAYSCHRYVCMVVKREREKYNKTTLLLVWLVHISVGCASVISTNKVGRSWLSYFYYFIYHHNLGLCINHISKWGGGVFSNIQFTYLIYLFCKSLK